MEATAETTGEKTDGTMKRRKKTELLVFIAEQNFQKKVGLELRIRYQIVSSRRRYLDGDGINYRDQLCEKGLNKVLKPVSYYSMTSSDFASKVSLKSKNEYLKSLETRFSMKVWRWKICNYSCPKLNQNSISQKILFRNICRVTDQLTLHRCKIGVAFLQRYLAGTRHLKSLVFSECKIDSEDKQTKQKFSPSFSRSKELGHVAPQYLTFDNCIIPSSIELFEMIDQLIFKILKKILGTVFCESLSQIRFQNSYFSMDILDIVSNELNLSSYGVTSERDNGSLTFNFDSYSIQP
ncbi:unnamed protein product [Moneuplotes crassus]|uniref:Uncharacterized protein n=1 Tax=Euplotes crassus TaxID=5936 RepID=A0AAD2CXB1_EUPCR|nr:unnamed protein product [Moneuplotes crassus]